MKKVISVLLACALVFSMSTAVFADDSPSADAEVSVNVTAVESTDSGITVSAVTESVSAEDYAAAVALASAPEATLAEVVGETEAADYTLGYLVDISGDASAGSVTLSISGLTASSQVIVLHYVDGAWKQETAVPGEDTLTIYADSFSPFAIYVVEDEDTTVDDTDSDETESPTTGESNLMLYVAIVAILAAAGLAVSGRKIRG